MTREEQVKQYCAEQGFPYGSSPIINSVKAVIATEAIEWADEHPKSPWISVTERLPEEDSNCIVTNNISGGTSIAYYLRDAEVWLEAYSGDEIHGITHWFYKPKFEET